MATILIIEDDTPLQEAYSFILKTAGHNVVSALNGKEGLERTKKTVFDIILLDIHMPVMNGWEFLEKFQANKPPTTKIIVFSNMVEPDIQKQADSLGVYRSVLKSSMTPSEMLHLVSDTLVTKP